SLMLCEKLPAVEQYCAMLNGEWQKGPHERRSAWLMALSSKVSKKRVDCTDGIPSRTWPQSKITIGRGEECTLVLEDQKKHVSRVHVELEEQGEGSDRMTVVSKVNPIFMGGRRHGPGSRLDLAP